WLTVLPRAACLLLAVVAVVWTQPRPPERWLEELLQPGRGLCPRAGEAADAAGADVEVGVLDSGALAQGAQQTGGAGLLAAEPPEGEDDGAEHDEGDGLLAALGGDGATQRCGQKAAGRHRAGRGSGRGHGVQREGC